jgi:maltooligosyltrehalose trehalohydrolase
VTGSDEAAPGEGSCPSLGAWVAGDGVGFRVWAPRRTRVELVLEDGRGDSSEPLALERDPEGYWSMRVPGVGAGALYRFRLDGEGPYPDPASRFQPRGVHGPSQVVDPRAFRWRQPEWTGHPLEDMVVYELHVGTFTPEGTFAAAATRFPYLRDLGVTAVELMPVADFPGERNWGYDGVCLFAPARCYGEPDDLRRLVDEAHRLGLSVLLDVVYNHLGPDGAYLGLFSPEYFSSRHTTPWGAAVNLDGPGSAGARRFFVENACHWVSEYRLDGLRLDACHALVDDSTRHFLDELQQRVRQSVAPRRALVIAEDSRNLVRMVLPEAQGGWGLDAVWADDLHHQVRVALAGDRDGYYADFSGRAEDVAKTLGDGWFYQGQISKHMGGPRGTDPAPAPPRRFVVCIQNHDQVGNRALGERLHHQVDTAAWRAASTLLLTAPETPLLFMGQEWGTSSPFLFFTDHNETLGPLVTAGRRKEFAGFAAFSDPKARARIPDPQDSRTFERSRLAWNEREKGEHARLLALYRALLELRRELRPGHLERGQYDVSVVDGCIALHDARPGTTEVLVLVWLGAGKSAPETVRRCAVLSGRRWTVRLTTEDARFVEAPEDTGIDLDGAAPEVSFRRPGAVVLTA